jgi:ABC-type nitrate/sulfonate/bicarbonate transport system permease component
VKKNMGNKFVFNDRMIARWFYHSIPFALLFLFWELLARVIHNSFILPPFSLVAASVFSPSLAQHLASTLAFSLLGLLIISAVGLPLGILMHISKKAGWALNPFFWFLLFAFGIGTAGITPIVWFGLSQLTVLLHSVLIPIIVVALISGYGERLTAVRVGFLLCWSFRIGGEMMLGVITGIGSQLSWCYELHNMEMIYAIMLIMGFTGLFVDRVIKYAGNMVKEKYGR